MPNMNMNNRKSPIKQQQQQRLKHSHSIPVANLNNNGRMRSTSSMASSYPRMYNNNNNSNNHYHYHYYSNTTSPTAMSASSLPAVPLFYTDAYADPPECSSLPKPPESWYLPLSTNIDNEPVKKEEDNEKEKDMNLNISRTPIKPKAASLLSKSNLSRACYYTTNNQGFYSPYYSSTNSYQKFPTQYIAVKA